MTYKLALCCCLITFFSHANAQEEMLHIDFIELLAEIDDNEMLMLEKVITDIQAPARKDNQHNEDLGIAHEDSTQ